MCIPDGIVVNWLKDRIDWHQMELLSTGQKIALTGTKSLTCGHAAAPDRNRYIPWRQKIQNKGEDESVDWINSLSQKDSPVP